MADTEYTSFRSCAVPGCDKQTSKGRRICSMHLQRKQKYGSYEIARPHAPSPQIIPGEEWRAVVGYEGFYEVSDHGRVRRVGSACGATPGHMLVPCSNQGYWRLTLYRDGVPAHANIHRLVALAFLGPCPPGQVVNHKDRDRANSHKSNLEYVTPSENGLHSYRTGYAQKRGAASPRAKLTEAQVATIRRGGTSDAALARQFGVSESTIRNVRVGRRYRGVADGN